MGRYCKAYMLKELRQFINWEEQAENSRQETQETDNAKQQAARELTDDSIVYLQEDYTLTDGIYTDENILFEDITDEWKKFCNDTLEFSIPDYVDIVEKAVDANEMHTEQKESVTIESGPGDNEATGQTTITVKKKVTEQ